MMDIFIFNVGLGQCIFFYPRNNHNYAMMVDCGNTPEFEPVDFLIEKKFLSYNSVFEKYILRNLTMTNYDQDHFSGLPYLRSKVKITTVTFMRNLTGQEIKNIKGVITKAADEVIDIINNYNSDITEYNPPYTKHCYSLTKEDFPNETLDTNKLSQLVFVNYNNTRICIPGDLTTPAWDKHLLNQNVRTLLSNTDIFVASHHGREDGFNENVFKYCKPEVIILSDKDIIHTTQQGLTQTYAGQIKGNGIIFNGNTINLRKVLTTRNDGHLWIRIEENGTRTYRNFTI
jgi:hypothetical protein